VVDRATKIARAELVLCKALSVSIVDDTAALSVGVLVAEFAHHYELPAEFLELHQLSIGDYLLLLPDKPSTLRIYNEGRPILLALFMVVCRPTMVMTQGCIQDYPAYVDRCHHRWHPSACLGIGDGRASTRGMVLGEQAPSGHGQSV
jgi:hypothetical protein